MKSPAAAPSKLSSSVREFEKSFVRPKIGRTLMAGARIYNGKRTRHGLFADMLGVDAVSGEGVNFVWDMEVPFPDDVGSFDHVECTSVLEHCARPWLMAANIERVMCTGSTIFITVPFAWRLHSYPSDHWRLSVEAVRVIFPNIVWQQLLYADIELHDNPIIPSAVVGGHYFIARTEVCGFGAKA